MWLRRTKSMGEASYSHNRRVVPATNNSNIINKKYSLSLKKFWLNNSDVTQKNGKLEQNAESSVKSEEKTTWSEIPDVLLERIFEILVTPNDGWKTRKELYNVSSVCRTWRKVGHRYLLKNYRDSTTTSMIIHPSQLFALSTRSVFGLAKCYICRECISSSQYHYTLFLGSNHSDNTGKFLLFAVQQSWQSINIYMSKNTERNEPCAKLMSNLIGTSHKLLRLPESVFEEDTVLRIGKPLPQVECLASVHYKLRMKGMMRPRRLNVSLPDPSSHEFSKKYSRLSHSNSWRGGSLSSSCSTKTKINDNTGENSHVTCIENNSHHKNFSLVNKPPHWNSVLKCWCLNFRGRVKLASVKNFQLMCSNDSTNRIIMQFGKVDANIFIMDFNPLVISAVQAFSIALTSFEGRLLL